jgi:hypothetical protein
MAEVINLATFQLDTNKLQSNLNDLQDTYFDLRKEQKSFADQSKETAKQVDLLVKSQKALESASGDNTEAIDENQKQLDALLKTQKDLYKSEQNLAIQMGTVKKEINQTTTQLKAYQDAEGKTTSLINLGTAALEKQITNKNEARSANIALNNVANQLNPNIEEEARLLQELNDQMDKNTQFIKENSSATANQKSNVGNYTESIEEALKAQESFNGGIGGFIQQSAEAGGAGNVLTGAFSAIRVGILGALKAGLAFIATPIGAVIAALAVAVGAVVGAFKLAKSSLESTEKGTQKLAIVTGAITGIFNGLFKVVKPLGLFLADVFIKTLENVGAVAEKTLGLIADALEFVGADETAKGIRKFTDEVKSASVASANLAKAEGELAVQQRQATKIQLDYQKQAEKLRQQRDDETKSISQRIAINNQLGQVLQKQSASELSIANKALQVANLKVKAEGETTEALNQRAEALTNISDIQERITGQESEQLANLNSLRKEAADKQKELDEQAIERALTKSRAEIDLFVATQGFKKKSLEDEFAFNKTLADKELADLKLQYDKKKISATEYEVGKAQIATDFAQKNAELTIQNAELELDAQTSKNQRILENDKYLSDEQLKIKQDALTAQLTAETSFQKTLLEKGKINQAEYDAAIAVIKAESKVKSDELIAVNKVAEQEKALLDLENQKIINEENFIAQAEIEKAQNEIKRQQEVANAEKTGADVSLINAKYAQQEKDINQKVLDQKLSATADIFGGIAQILGENSKAGKAAAIAQATINTYQGVTAAWSAPAVLPQPFDTISKVAASGVALMSGLKAVKQITATKEASVKKPSYATGVIGLRGSGSGTTDSINANLSAGESVINARSTSMFANELSAINQAGGGVGINGASNILNQNDLNNNANNSQMAQMIAEAVAIGAEAGTKSGSQSGIKELSNDRKVMSDAKF